MFAFLSLLIFFGVLLGVSGVIVGAFEIYQRKTFFSRFLKSFKRDRRGVFYVWVAVAIFITVILIMWFPLSWVIYQTIDVVTSSYTFPPEAQGTITLMKNVVAWFVDIAVGGFILWAYVASQKREDVTYAY